MIQELTDCGPSRTYPVYYLEDAMNNLGDCFDYAVNDYGAEGSEVAELFSPKGRATNQGRCQIEPTDSKRHRNIGQAGYWHTFSGA